MHNRTFLLLLLLNLVAGIAWAGEKIDPDQVQMLRKQGVIMPLNDILLSLQKIKRGRIMEVELKKKHNQYVYEIEVVDGNGTVWEFKIDASDGSLISTEQDD